MYGKGGLCMQITDVRIRRVEKEGKMKAVVSITIDNSFAVHDIKIVEGPDNYFVSMPSRRTKNGSFRDTAHPINAEARTQIVETILNAYNKELSNQN